jgi:peptidoglycan glycosyltransferase
MAVTILILVLVAQLTYLQIVDAKNLEDNPLNVRAQLRDINRPRGDIVTADGEVAARSVKSTDTTDFKFQREYPLGPLTSQIVGYQSFVPACNVSPNRSSGNSAARWCCSM